MKTLELARDRTILGQTSSIPPKCNWNYNVGGRRVCREASIRGRRPVLQEPSLNTCCVFSSLGSVVTDRLPDPHDTAARSAGKALRERSSEGAHVHCLGCHRAEPGLHTVLWTHRLFLNDTVALAAGPGGTL